MKTITFPLAALILTGCAAAPYQAPNPTPASQCGAVMIHELTTSEVLEDALDACLANGNVLSDVCVRAHTAVQFRNESNVANDALECIELYNAAPADGFENMVERSSRVNAKLRRVLVLLQKYEA